MKKAIEVLGQDWVKELLAQPLLARLGTADPQKIELIKIGYDEASFV